MNEALINGIVELARYAVLAYGINQGRVVVVRWLERLPVQPVQEQQIDAARKAGAVGYVEAER
jgi:hypothetical protein